MIWPQILHVHNYVTIWRDVYVNGLDNFDTYIYAEHLQFH